MKVRLILAGVIVVLGATVIPTTWRPAGAAFPGSNGRIVFVSDGMGGSDVFVMDPDGSARTNLTNSSGRESYPKWSPDGTKILYVMNASGANPVKITAQGFYVDAAQWSPDGAKIVAARVPEQTRPYVELYVMNADGTGAVQITSGPGDKSFPVWSPGGDKIAYMFSGDIYVLNPDGTGNKVVAYGSGAELGPAWSPDGAKIYFDYLSEIYFVNADGTNRTKIAIAGGGKRPAPSPDGTKLAFQRDDGSVLVSNIDGTGAADLTTSATYDLEPDWQPVGATLPPASSPAPTASSPGSNTPTPQPSASPSPTPTPASTPTHTFYYREVSLALREHVIARGRVTVADGFTPCAAEAPVVIQRRREGAWVVVGRATTGTDGSYRTRLPDRVGRYRARAARFETDTPGGTGICQTAVSDPRSHLH